MNEVLVSPEWLQLHLEDENLIVLYTTLVAKKAEIPDSINKLQLKGARFFDLQHVFSDQNSGLPNTYPDECQFEEACRALGINRTSKIVVYDSLGIYSSPRVWFLFKSMGHESVFVLNGGLQNWIQKGYPTIEKTETIVAKGNFKAQRNLTFLKTKKELKENLNTQQFQVIDARSNIRFKGETPEPRIGLKSGHIPHSVNLHYADLLSNGIYKNEEELKQLLSATVKDERPIVFSCGSGITACILYLAAHVLLNNELFLYDGSWTEWGQIEK